MCRSTASAAKGAPRTDRPHFATLFEPLGLRDAGDTEQQIRGLNRDPANGWLAYPDIVKMSAEVRSRVSSISAKGEVPLVLGGCCTLLPAALAGACDAHGKLGLAYFDGHLDLFTGRTSPTGEGADMPAAAILGLAPEDLVDTIGPTPIVEPGNIAFLGARDEEELEMIAPLPKGLGIGRIEDRDALRHADLEHVAHSVADELTADGGHFWLHLDVDVLDRDAFPATDYLMPDGLSRRRAQGADGPAGRIPAPGRDQRHLLQPGEGQGRILRHRFGRDAEKYTDHLESTSARSRIKSP